MKKDKYGRLIKTMPLLKPYCEICGREGIALNEDLICLGCYYNQSLRKHKDNKNEK